MPQIKEKARECSPGEPVSKECAAKGKGDERTVIGNVLGRRSRAHSGTAWATAGGGGGWWSFHLICIWKRITGEKEECYTPAEIPPEFRTGWLWQMIEIAFVYLGSTPWEKVRAVWLIHN